MLRLMRHLCYSFVGHTRDQSKFMETDDASLLLLIANPIYNKIKIVYNDFVTF